MESSSTPETPAQPVEAGGNQAARSRNLFWALLWGLLVIPVTSVGFLVAGAAGKLLHLDFLQADRFALGLSSGGALSLASLTIWWGIRRGWNSPKALRWGWALTIPFLPLVMIWISSILGSRIRPSTVDKAVLINARHLAAAANQYFTDRGATTCALTDLVGPDKYVKALSLVAEETYPVSYTQGVAITVAGVAGARTITYAP